MIALRAFIRDEDGGPAAEFALVLPIALLFLFGIIDVGRYMWSINQAEKATQMGARYAVATNPVATGLAGYDFATQCGVPGGNEITQQQFPGIDCTGAGTALAPTTSCALRAASTCSTAIPTTSGTAGNDAFRLLFQRMSAMKPDITPANVRISYAYSGIGYAGKPGAGNMDVSPLVIVQLRNLPFTPTLGAFLGVSFDLPDLSYSLTMEDGAGIISN
jgi:TadE-like protein